MQSIVCARCGHSTPTNSASKLGDVLYCETCGLAEWESRGRPIDAGSMPERLVDPTVCARCGHDHGSESLPSLGGQPTCASCISQARQWPYPLWVRGSFVALLALAAISFFVNLRFLRGYVEVTRAVRQMQLKDLDGAAAAATAAAALVPEAGEVQAISAFYRGLMLLRDEKPVEAVPLLEIARRDLNDPSLDPLVLTAQAGAAFDQKDYDRFLNRMVATQKLRPGAMGEAGVASALACKFAVSGDDTFAQQALAHLEAARKLEDAASAEYREYEERILHRLATREILSRAAYLKRMGR